MKKIIFVFLILVNKFSLYAQINKIETLRPTNKTIIKFDSLVNFVDNNVIDLIGQEIYIIGDEAKNEFNGFSKKNPIDDIKKYSSIGRNNNDYIKYEDIAEKYFTILDVLKYTKSDRSSFSNAKFILKLEQKDSKQVYYYSYPTREFEVPFIVVGYFLKMKKLYINQNYISRGLNWNSYDNPYEPIYNIVNGKQIINFTIGEEWKVIELSIQNKTKIYSSIYDNLFFILENKFNEKVSIPFLVINYEWAILEKSKSDYIKNKFGDIIWNKILSRKIWIGMTEDMLLFSIGKPDKINKTITETNKSEQWYYQEKLSNKTGDHYYYFENGILKAIQ